VVMDICGVLVKGFCLLLQVGTRIVDGVSAAHLLLCIGSEAFAKRRRQSKSRTLSIVDSVSAGKTRQLSSREICE